MKSLGITLGCELGHMETDSTSDDAVEILQQLGLKEYEAKCFVGLSRISTGTAKQLGQITDVPRTRVYDAVRVLEARGLVEIQHSSPQHFRAVPLAEAIETLRTQYEIRVERLEDALKSADRLDPGTEGPAQEVWSMTGTTAIANRTNQLIKQADNEVVLVLGDPSLLTGNLVGSLNNMDTGTDLYIGAISPALEARIKDDIPRATTFLSGLDWLRNSVDADEVAIGRLLLVDRSTILVSTIHPETLDEHAIFGGVSRTGWS